MSSDERILKAARFLLHSPPGEVDDVFNDIRGIVNDDDALYEKIEEIIAESNMQHFLIAEVPDKESSVLITPYNMIRPHQYLDPNTRTVFTFDHIRRVATELEELSTEDLPEGEELRSALQSEFEKYIESHYPEGKCSVFVHEGSMTCCLVSNKFSPSNFWNGSWRSVWSFNPENGQLNGSAKIKGHYYEDGNVQVDTQSDFAEDITERVGMDPETLAKKIVKLIASFEAEFQKGINDGYHQLSEKTFKGLRRMLPVSRNKINWDKIASYKITSSLANADN